MQLVPPKCMQPQIMTFAGCLNVGAKCSILSGERGPLRHWWLDLNGRFITEDDSSPVINSPGAPLPTGAASASWQQ